MYRDAFRSSGTNILWVNNFIGRTSCSNVSGYIISVVASFLITPITIHTLGDARYGAWSLVAELIGYYGLLDLGIRGAVTYYVARYSARNQGEDVKEIVSSAFWFLFARHWYPSSVRGLHLRSRICSGQKG
jgi:hypothetical protein